MKGFRKAFARVGSRKNLRGESLREPENSQLNEEEVATRIEKSGSLSNMGLTGPKNRQMGRMKNLGDAMKSMRLASTRNFRLRRGDAEEPTITTDDSSASSSASSEPSAGQPKKHFRFATNPDGEVQCEVIRFKKYKNANLWWSTQECDFIQMDCVDAIEDNKMGDYCISDLTVHYVKHGRRQGYANLNRDVLLQMREVPDIRGLERHVMEGYEDMMDRHVENVLQIQERSNSEYLLRLASRQTSQPWEELAMIRARYDSMAVRQERHNLVRHLSSPKLSRNRKKLSSKAMMHSSHNWADVKFSADL